MIARMKKVFLVARAAEREALLESLRELGVIHLEPVDASATAPGQLRAKLGRHRRALQILANVTPAGEKPDVDTQAAAGEVLTIARRAQESRDRLSALGREADRLAIWGNLRRRQLESLAESGVKVAFYSVPTRQIGQVSSECVAALAELPGKRTLLALVQREGEPAVPEEARLIQWPARDLPTVRAEARQLDASLAEDAERLARLANLSSEIEQEGVRLNEQVQFAGALAGAMQREDLFAVQGWTPQETSETLSADLAGRGIDAAVNARDPSPDEEPPTLIRYPRWARPMKGLFDILGTYPGYREFDVAGFFMIALPIFAAMLIGDAGYGLLFLLLPLLCYRKAVALAGVAKVHLVMVIGGVAVVWGLLTGTIFGLNPTQIAGAGSILAVIGRGLDRVWIIRGQLTEQTVPIMKLSFVLGTIHLSAAQLRQALRFAPNLRFVAHVGWAVFLWGVLGIVWYMFFVSQQAQPGPLHPAATWALSGGATLAILFAHPSRNPAKMVMFGLASFLLAAMSTFSDTISYIRLMAVGIATSALAQTFNGLGARAAETATWIAGAPIVLLGHGLNIALCLVAILAHGVRLNMLEFSSNAGVEWAGYPYQPFAKVPIKEN